MTNEELEEEIYTLNLQNNTEKTDFDKAFRYGIECSIEHLTELNLLPIQDVNVSFTSRLYEVAFNYESSVSERMDEIKNILVNEL